MDDDHVLLLAVDVQREDFRNGGDRRLAVLKGHVIQPEAQSLWIRYAHDAPVLRHAEDEVGDVPDFVDFREGG
jgi:hypothetical protein